MNKHGRTLFVVLAIGLAVIACALHFPGAMTWDSLDQLRQARVHEYLDWQPPAMAYVWHHLLWLGDGPGPMLIFHVGMLCLASVLLYGWSVRQGLRYGAVFALIPLLPWVMNFEFTIWKDIGMAFSWLLAVAIAIFYADRERFPWLALVPHHLLDYVGYRLGAFVTLLRSPDRKVYYGSEFRVPEPPYIVGSAERTLPRPAEWVQDYVEGAVKALPGP